MLQTKEVKKSREKRRILHHLYLGKEMTFRDIFLLLGKTNFSYKNYCSVQINAQMGLHRDGAKNITTKDPKKNKKIYISYISKKYKTFREDLFY